MIANDNTIPPAVSDPESVAQAYGQDPERPEESKLCQEWQERIAESRKFMDEIVKQYAVDRKYAAGESKEYEVRCNLVGTYIDILVAFIYARDPDLSIRPAPAVGPSRRRDYKDFAKTLEIVLSRMWRRGRLKRSARQWVRSALTIGIGWLKSSWMERTGRDPVVEKDLNDLQDNLERVRAQMEAVEEGGCGDLELERERLESELAGLEAAVEKVISRGFVFDLVPGEDMTVSMACANILNYQDAPWISHRVFLPVKEAAAKFNLSEEDCGACSRYQMREPKPAIEGESPVGREHNSEDASQYQASGANMIASRDGDFVCVEELWSKDDNQIFTMIEGLARWVREPFSPPPSSRFYGFFGLAFTEVDGRRHPQSLVERSIPLIDEYNRTLTALARIRKRTRPKTAFNAGMISPADALKLNRAVEQEMVGLKLVGGSKANIQNALLPISYAQVDMALYENTQTRQLLDTTWGIQEALSSAVTVPKTATEAEIQQTGTNARTGAMRDAQEDVLTDLAQYCAEVALSRMSMADAQSVAGPSALWIEASTPDDLDAMLEIEIKAGSSGKPDTAREREAWGAIFPILVDGVTKIAELRGASPLDLADAIEKLIEETVRRGGDELDLSDLIPQAPMVPPGVPGMPGDMPPGMPGAELPPGPPPAGMPQDLVAPTDLPPRALPADPQAVMA